MFLVVALTRGIPRISSPRWFLATQLVCLLVDLAATIAIWNWRRWGVPAIVILSGFAAVLNLSLGVPWYSVLIGLCGAITVVILVRPIWAYMK